MDSMKVCVILAGMKQMLRHSAIQFVDTVVCNSRTSLSLSLSLSLSQACMNFNISVSIIVAEPLYGLGFPQKRYAPRTFNCSKQDHSLHDCSYTSDFDPECNNGSHVAGVRCRLSKLRPFILHDRVYII